MRWKKCVRLSADCIKIEHSAMQNALINLAGAVRFELTTKVLETHVLPLHHAPSLTHKPTNIYYYIYFQAICQYLFENNSRTCAPRGSAGSRGRTQSSMAALRVRISRKISTGFSSSSLILPFTKPCVLMMMFSTSLWSSSGVITAFFRSTCSMMSAP